MNNFSHQPLAFSLSKQGFTLLELLVTLLIISILAGALVPAIGAARELARSTACKSNLRQMIIAAHAYASENDDEFPPAYARNYAKQTTTTWEDFLWNFDSRSATSQKVHQCPSFKGSAMWTGDRYTGYNYNSSYIGGERHIINGVVNPASTRSAALYDIKDPGRCAVFGDGEYASGANKFMRSPFPGPLDAGAGTALAGTQGFRHRGATHVAFADASVQSLKTRHTTTVTDRKNPANSPTPAKNCGFLSVDNSLYNLE